jgi:hypothetical protein
MEKLNLFRVRAVDYHTELKVGSILVKNGAWNRKYRVVAITKQGDTVSTQNGQREVTNYTVEVEFLGHFYATGRYIPPSKHAINTEHMVPVYQYLSTATKAVLNAPAGYVQVEEDI